MTTYGTLDRRMARGALIDFLNANPPATRASLDVTAYGDNVGGGGDDTVAVRAAVAAAMALGAGSYGVDVVFPGGRRYQLSGELNLDHAYNVTLRGAAGPVAGGLEATTATLRFTQSGTGNCISAQSSTAVHLVGLRIMADNAAFTGTIVNLDGALGYDTQHAVVERCHITGDLATAGAGVGLSLDRAIIVKVADSLFAYVGLGVRGVNGNYSNVVTLDNVAFYKTRVAAVKNGGEAWALRNCTFEQRIDGCASGYTASSEAIGPVTFDNCWFGDAGTTGVPWIRFIGSGLSIRGCQFGIASSDCPAVQVGNDIDGSPVNGVTLSGTRFMSDYALGTFGTGVVYNLVASGCRFNGTHVVTDAGALLRNPIILDGATGVAFDLHVTGKLQAAGGLAVGNSAAATTPGSVTKKFAVYNSETGVLLGYVPLYSAIT